MNKEYDVVALGNTLMDFLVEVDDDRFVEFNLKKGEMQLVEEEEAKTILLKLKEHELEVELVPGGSAANVLRCMGLLGSSVVLVGKVGNDEHGKTYQEEMKNHNVIPRINGNDKVTGHAITFITPDSERSFSVHLGAALELYKEDVLEEDVAKSKVLHLEGYQLEGSSKEAVLRAVQFAKKHGTKVSIDLSDGGVIRRNLKFMEEFLREHVDIVFANEIEAEDFTGTIEAEAAALLGEYCEIAVVKVGDQGSFIRYDKLVIKVDAINATPIDTTGAGDTYAAGFLHGYCSGWGLEDCGKLGAKLAARVIEKRGVKFDREEIESIRREFS